MDKRIAYLSRVSMEDKFIEDTKSENGDIDPQDNISVLRAHPNGDMTEPETGEGKKTKPLSKERNNYTRHSS